MTLEEIQQRAKEIEELQGDYEAAHGKEDDLYKDLLEYIRANAPDPFSKMAAEALLTQNLEFPRYCA